MTSAPALNTTPPGFDVDDPTPRGGAIVEAETVVLPRVHVPADELPVISSGQVPGSASSEAINKLHERVDAALASGADGSGPLPSSVQRELGHLVGLLPHVAASGDQLLINALDLTLSSLLGSNPNVVFARETRLNIAQRLGIYPSLWWALTSTSVPAVRVMTGLLVVVILAIPLLVTTVFLLRAHFAHLNEPTLDIDDIILFGVFGAAGSVVSIMVRIDEFNRWPPDPSILFFTGLFKPIIGFFFAIFVLLVLNSGIVQISVAEARQAYFFMAICFIAGFSERFARDIVAQTESLFPTSGEQPGRPARRAVRRAAKQ